MKHFILIALAMMLCISCSGQPQPLGDIPEMEYGNCEEKEVEVNYIMFDFCNVIDFNYEVETHIYTITYDDADVFDYDNMAYLSGEDEWYGEFVIVYLSEKDFFDLLADMNKSQKDKWDMVYQEKWQLKEVATPVEGGTNYKYYLIKNPIYAE